MNLKPVAALYRLEEWRQLVGGAESGFDGLVGPVEAEESKQHQEEADQQGGQEVQKDLPPRYRTCYTKTDK